MPSQRSILVVSDERAEREAAQSILTAAGLCEIETVESQETALELLRSKSFDCVLCHSAAGAEDAVTFLTEVWNRKPNTARFVLAPEIDPETQVRCAFGAHQYLPVPLQQSAIRAALEEAGTRQAILPNARVQTLISRMRSIPSKPSIYFEVMRELRCEQAQAEVIANLIQRDAGIATKLLQVVNSLFYGRAEAVHDIQEAVLFLGFEVTAVIVLSLEAIARFEQCQPLNELAAAVWAHSQPLAELTRRIAQSFNQGRAACDQAYLAGLLHDIGKLALAHNYPGEYQTILRNSGQAKRSLLELEEEILGVSHAEAGAYLLAVWGMPMVIVEAVAHHHAPAEEITTFSPAAALHIAEALLESDHPLEEVIRRYPAELGLLQESETFNSLLPDRTDRALATETGDPENRGTCSETRTA